MIEWWPNSDLSVGSNVQTRGEPFVEIDDVTVDDRDIEALRAIDEHGSMHRAAAELGRSYARIQQRVSELEETVGSLVARERGGRGGGGSTLTPDAYELLARFDRLRAEFSGLARAEESVFRGTVVSREGKIGTVETSAGPVRGVVFTDVDAVQISVRSDAVALTTPDEAPQPAETSVRNQFQGTVTQIESEGGIARVEIDVGAETPLRTLITESSVETLDLREGDPVVASFKATAARAVPRPPPE